ncbi:polysaccharide pyruvyl transferase family protein [Geodermatophilus sp. FMUSA9-8]|uniref:polysaccharide pyruvyl transferase family protein n=1 Tax=Geodermatophilus sp. FMUSA9-8 TaxID=3120155 RepID=UPI0030091941
MSQVFAVGRGQYDNIGDIVLRRQLLDWVRPAGELHVYVGESPAGYDDGLRLAPTDRVYRSFRAWYRAALDAALAGEGRYVFKPGEIQLTLPGMKEHLSVLPLLATLRARGGRAVRAGVGTRNYAPLPRALMRPSIALSDLTLWRDVSTGAYMGSGGVMPDLAFGEGAPDEEVAGFAAPAPDRDVLVVSMRSDGVTRPWPSDAWVEGVRRHAAAHGLTPWAVTQVRDDEACTRRLAEQLGGEALTWAPETPHDVQEDRLRALYRRTSIVVSDRLHVVIAAYTEGALPAGATTRPSDKVARHLRTIGINDVTLDAGDTTADDVSRRLDEISRRRPELTARLLEARATLRRHRDQVRRVLGMPTSAAVYDLEERLAG